ncbi:MAG: c-type cytochrome domain-containing protein [Bryobacteraceae bacterium]
MLAFSGAAYCQTWTADIFPLLDKRCGGCHGGEAKMGEFSVNTFQMMMRGGNHGTPVVAGDPDESLLYQIVIGKAYPKMPMDGTTLSEGETELIKKWIAAGGKGPATPETVKTSAPAPQVKPRVEPKPQIFSMAWQPKGNLIALGRHRSVTLMDAATSKPVASLDGLADSARAVAFSADGKFVAAAGGKCAKPGQVKIWDVETKAVSAEISGHSDCIYGLAFAPDGKTVATASYDKLIKLWDTASGKEVRTLKDHIDAVYALAFTRDGKRLISGSADRGVKIWNPATGERLYTFTEATDGVNTVAVDPSGQMVAAAGLDKSVRIWRMGATGGEMLHSLTAHEDAILKLAWSPDGKMIVSSSADHTLKILRASDLTELRIIPAQPDWAYGLEFSPDGRKLAIGRMDGSFSVIDVDDRMTAAR